MDEKNGKLSGRAWIWMMTTNLDHEETISVSASDVVDSSEVEWEEVVMKNEEVLVSFTTSIKKKMSQPLTSYCPFSPTMISRRQKPSCPPPPMSCPS